jgi:hypothetical protein
MEVHHHPRVEKKSIKEYLFEYIMIVLAVITGFFAESLRDYLNDHHKEHEYIINIKKDLETDTANLNIWLPGMLGSIENLDTLVYLLQNPLHTQRGSDLYYLARLATRARLFESTDNTITEMKNSGNFRLISKQEVLDDLVNIEKTKERYLALNTVSSQEATLLYPLIGKLFDEAIFTQMIIPGSVASTISEKQYAESSKDFLQRPPGNPQLRLYDKDLINQLCYYVHQRRSTFEGEIRVVNTLKQADIRLMQALNKAYNLEDE